MGEIIALLVFIVISVGVAFAGGIILNNKLKKEKNHTAKIKGHITGTYKSVESIHGLENNQLIRRKRIGRIPEYEYTVNEKTYPHRAQIAIVGLIIYFFIYGIDRKVTVIYDPENPSDHHIRSDKILGSLGALLCIVLGMFFAVGLFIALLYQF